MADIAAPPVGNALRPLPRKIEDRLSELLALGDFDAAEVAWCRSAYWGARDDWHQILIACYERAKQRDILLPTNL